MAESSVAVSIIIPAYNSGETIERAVRSALSQTYTDIEVIVVDDGSTDETPAVIEAIAGEDERVRVLLKPRGGVSAARNDGIMSARGEWFMTLDADDYLDPEAVSVLLDAALRTDADLIMCGVRLIYPDGTRKTYSAPDNYTDEKSDFISNLFTELYDHLLITTHANKIYRTSVSWNNEIYYSPLLSVNEDIDFVLRFMLHSESIGVVKGVYLNYVQHQRGESLINTFSPYGIAGSVLVLRDMTDLFNGIDVSNRAIRAMNLRLFWHILSYLGIMYRDSGYTDERKLIELRELASREEFAGLLRDVSPEGPKSALAKLLLSLRLYGVYHALSKLLYKDKSEASDRLAAAPAIYRELSRIPYDMLFGGEAPEEEPEPLKEEPEPLKEEPEPLKEEPEPLKETSPEEEPPGETPEPAGETPEPPEEDLPEEEPEPPEEDLPEEEPEPTITKAQLAAARDRLKTRQEL